MNTVRAERYSWWRALRSAPVSPTARHVALALSTYMDRDGGECFPAMSTLAKDTARSRRTVARAVSELDESGYLRVTSGGGRLPSGSYAPNHYQACMPVSHAMDDTDDVDDTDAREAVEAVASIGAVTPEPPWVTPEHGAVTPVTVSGVTHGTRSTQELAIEVPKEEPMSCPPGEQGRKIARRVKAGALSEEEGRAAAALVPGVGPRGEFERAFDDELRTEVAS